MAGVAGDAPLPDPAAAGRGGEAPRRAPEVAGEGPPLAAEVAGEAPLLAPEVVPDVAEPAAYVAW